MTSGTAQFRMIDIGAKVDTNRVAIASGVFRAKPETLTRVRDRQLPKGDVLLLAEVAGIQGAKLTSQLLPLCHPLPLTSVRVWMDLEENLIRVWCEAKTIGKTGVEMEALCGVQAALLCLYDLTKGIDPVLTIGETKLELKAGGKSGLWTNPESENAQSLKAEFREATVRKNSVAEVNLEKRTAAVIVLSDRCAEGKAQDLSGPVAHQWLIQAGAKTLDPIVLPDSAQKLREILEDQVLKEETDVIVTSGGTGLSTRDITPETVQIFAESNKGREIPGLGEVLRNDGSRHTSLSWLSRSTAYLVRNSLILCLPGSPRAVTQGLTAVGHLIAHALEIRDGAAHGHSSKKGHA